MNRIDVYFSKDKGTIFHIWLFGHLLYSHYLFTNEMFSILWAEQVMFDTYVFRVNNSVTTDYCSIYRFQTILSLFARVLVSVLFVSVCKYYCL